jgi:hypothetical protein
MNAVGTGLLANATMLAFTPLHGSHYLVDVTVRVGLNTAEPISS